MKLTTAKSQMILIAGPYRSGTNDDPVLIKKNVREMESYALPIFRAGHIPILGEWLALPLAELGGSKSLGDAVFNEVFHPIAVAAGKMRCRAPRWRAFGGSGRDGARGAKPGLEDLCKRRGNSRTHAAGVTGGTSPTVRYQYLSAAVQRSLCGGCTWPPSLTSPFAALKPAIQISPLFPLAP